MALKDKLMTLEDFKAVRDVDVASNSAQFTEIKADLDSLGNGVPTEVRQAMLTLFQSAAYAETGLTDEIAVIESWAAVVAAIALNQSSISISGASTSQLVATTTPTGGTVTWVSSDTSVATVSSSGLVTGVGNGSCTITASCGGKTATCSVTVSGFASLTGITATYTQPGTVYNTDTLDSLKSDLVVTANYSDSTTRTLSDSDYTLSGTLAEGISTITVSYGGKTTTFNVTVTEYTGISAESGIIKTDGTEAENTKRARTDYIPATGRVFKVSAYVNSDSANTASYAIRYYDANYTFIGSVDSQKTVPKANVGGHYLLTGWLAGDGTEYTDNSTLNGVMAYIRLVFRNTADSTITDISGTVTVDGIVYDIVYE